jgi:dTDP-4-dehydrorhamnose 3,5-epimerase
LEGVLLVTPVKFPDDRGFFLETFRDNAYRELGLSGAFVQDNHSRSTKGVLRGLHFQTRRPQGKLIRVSRGAIFDVAVDIRPDSPTVGEWTGRVLDDQEHQQLWIPPGFAHGFYTLSESADVTYKCTEYFYGDEQGGVRWDCSDIGIEWPNNDPILSPRDQTWPGLDQLLQGVT